MRGVWDVVVIGSGPNGLAAAITAAAAGRQVLVVEAAGSLGGGLATEELTLPGFRHDVFSAVHPAAAASPVFRRWPLHEHGLTWIHPAVALAHPQVDGGAVALHGGPEGLAATRESLARTDPAGAAAWEAFTAPYLRRFPGVRDTFLGAFPPVGAGMRLAAGLGVAGAADLGRLLLVSARSLAGELFSADGPRAWLYGTALHGDVPVEHPGSAVTAVWLTLLGQASGWPSPRGGASSLAEALISYARTLGVAFRTGAPARQLLASGGRVSGVVAGDPVRARAVICALTAPAVVRLAGEVLPAGYLRRLTGFRSGPATVKVDWALSGPLPWTAADCRLAGTVHVGGGSAEVALAGRELDLGRLPERPFVLVGQQSVADPTRAPAGRHTAWAYTRVPHGVGEADVRRQVERVRAQVERFAPGFAGRVLAEHVAAPGWLQGRNANVAGGDTLGGSIALDQLVFRPVPGISPCRTPVRGLYLGGASVFPGGGVHGVPGAAAARCAVRDLTWRRIR